MVKGIKRKTLEEGSEGGLTARLTMVSIAAQSEKA